MRFTITDPTTDTQLELKAEPEDYKGEQGWRIIFPEKDSFVMVEKNQQWQVMDESDINPDLIEAIAQAFKPLDRYNHLT